jgi:membrane protein
LALVTLLFGASGVFTELRGSLNAIWEVTAAKGGGVKGMVAQRVGAFLMVLGLGALLLFSLLLSAALAVMEQFATSYVPVPAAILGEVLNVVSSLCLLTLLFALIYKFVPDTPLQWRDVTVGAAVTSALFMVGKTLLAIYFSTAAVGSTYGAAGSVVAFVVWVYYSAQIFFLGAVFTRTFARRVGSQKRVIAPPFVKAQNA